MCCSNGLFVAVASGGSGVEEWTRVAAICESGSVGVEGGFNFGHLEFLFLALVLLEIEMRIARDQDAACSYLYNFYTLHEQLFAKQGSTNNEGIQFLTCHVYSPQLTSMCMSATGQ